MMRSLRSLVPSLVLGILATPLVSGYRVPISDTDSLREACSGMFGGKTAYIEVSFDPSSSGQVAMIIYEWSDVPYLGVDTPDDSVGGSGLKTYICTTSAGLCETSQLGSFITSLPEGYDLNTTSIFTTALQFSASSFPSTPTPIDQPATLPDEGNDIGTPVPVDEGLGSGEFDDGTRTGQAEEDGVPESVEDEIQEIEEELGIDIGRRAEAARSKRQWDDMVDSVTNGLGRPTGGEDGTVEETGEDVGYDAGYGSEELDSGLGSASGFDAGIESGSDAVLGAYTVPTYSAPIQYAVPKTGYYCVGIVPVTLVNERSGKSDKRQTHAEYAGMVLFKNTFEGELPAVEYPKIGFYLGMSILYVVLGSGWAFLCVRHLSELLPMQYYISGTIIFLIVEMIAQFAYYRYINKHGGGTTSLAFLFVIAVLNAARNSLSFFLLLIVSMGLSVVTQSLGSVMGKVRLLTGFHFIFGVLYSVGTVQVELDNAPLYLVLVLIFPLALTLTAFLMWIIISLNGTILHLQQRKQRYKLQKFQRLWRILIVAVIAVAAFFVISSMSLSNRLDEDYAPRNWRYRWILLDGSLATIYLAAFSAIAWLWRPTRDNIRFSMSQELAQDEHEADAEDYEIDDLENGNGHRPLRQDDDDFEDGDGDGDDLRKGHKGVGVGEENVVFAMGDDSDDEEHEGQSGKYRDGDGHADGEGTGGKGKKEGYRDDEEEEEDGDNTGRKGLGERRLS